MAEGGGGKERSRVQFRNWDDEKRGRGVAPVMEPMGMAPRRGGRGRPMREEMSADDLNQRFLDGLSRQKMEDESVSTAEPPRRRSPLPTYADSGNGMKAGGLVRGDGCAARGKTRGAMR